MRKYFYILFAFVLAFSSCKENTENIEVEINLTSENLLNATIWYQQSAEMQACYYQAFNYSKNQLLRNIETSTTTKPKAVIVDIDETMLDNSPFEAYLIQNNETFNKDLWYKWVNLASAKALPGAVDFSIFAKENEVTVFYVSNRVVANIEPTVKNLQAEGFAYAENEYVLLKEETSDKTERRNLIAENYEVIMLIGDNLRDFDEIFTDRNSKFGFQIVEEHEDLFGTKYIMLPNPMYGQWEKAYKNPEGDTPQEQILENMRKSLISF
ncbi:MAG: 5'-nucleotidase, lipoprotein e(P4) family [Bacteroidales bacterium]|nr:5'-nucleotidase, lipoprotein e(P4) family [Bacteroidales bacterium]